MSGQFNAAVVSLANQVYGYGVFQGVQTSGTYQTSTDPAAGGDLVLPFNASNSNTLYGASTTVQPDGLYAQYLIRYAA